MSSSETTKESIFSLPRVLIALISIAGFGIMAYLTYIHFTDTVAFCDINSTASCSSITTGIYSKFFGLPLSILGMSYFGLIFLLVLLRRNQEVFKLIFLLTVFVLVPSLYLTAIEAFVIKRFCILCESSKAVMIAIAAASFIAMKQKASVVVKAAVPVLVAGLVAAVITYLAQTRM